MSIFLKGATGSGKTTQLPQFILEDACMKKKPCKIICTQPRRIAAIASAERVSYERNEKLGSTVGYQVRLESSVNPSSNCIFVTPGVFLRYLTGSNPTEVFNNITHIIIDEAHERAKENDFLLTSIKENFHLNPNLKLIIMTATMNSAVFASYFDNNCDEFAISTRQFNVEEIYLEDILKHVKFTNRKVEELNELERKGELTSKSRSNYVNELAKESEQSNTENDQEIDKETRDYLDEILTGLMGVDFEDNFENFKYLVQAENLPVDYRHSKTGFTALMICVQKEALNAVENLLNLGANPQLKMSLAELEIDCLGIAYKLFGSDSELCKTIQHHIDSIGTKKLSSSEIYDKALLDIYYDTILTNKRGNFVIEETIDHELIVKIIKKIHSETPIDGGILCFLPGFDDIIQIDKVLKEELESGFEMFMLHSSMKTEDQKNVFKTIQNLRKIILSTNIAESSITVPDVVYVVDAGREKQKSYDSITHSSSLKVQWISKASANQRKGRAGRLRDGFVFRVYSKDRFQSMMDDTIPELLRNSISEICLQSKLLVGNSVKIEEFLGRCIAKPSQASIKQSIKLLQSLGALDENENLTFLGSHLAEMPVDAKYGKMIIYSIILRCFSPILSIVSVLSMSDQVFILPLKASDRYECTKIRRALGQGAMSDHYVMLKIFDMWMEIKNKRLNEWKFCEENFINQIFMERAKGVRGQILSYLQSSGLVTKTDEIDSNSQNWPVIKACLSAGLYPNIARVDRSARKIYTDIDDKLAIHMTSVMSEKNDKTMEFVRNFPADWILFEEKNRVGRLAMIRCNTLVNNYCLLLCSGAGLNSQIVADLEDFDNEEKLFLLQIDNNITFVTESHDTGNLILETRGMFEDLVTKFLKTKSSKFTKQEEILIDSIAKVLEIEEKRSGFEQASLKIPARTQQIIQKNQVKPIFRSSQHQQQPTTSNSNFFYETQKIQRDKNKYFVTKIREIFLNRFNNRTKCAVEELNLSPWLVDRIYMQKVKIILILVSSESNEFLCYGDINSTPRKNQEKFFNLKRTKRFSLVDLRQKFYFRNFTLFERFPTEELSFEVGKNLIDIFHS